MFIPSPQEVEMKREAMFQMYGEKAKEADELKLDIKDLKTVHVQTIGSCADGCPMLK